MNQRKHYCLLLKYPASQSPLILGQLHLLDSKWKLTLNPLTTFHVHHHLHAFLLSLRAFSDTAGAHGPRPRHGPARKCRVLTPRGSPLPMRCEDQWVDAVPSYPQADKSQKHSARVSSSLSRIKPLHVAYSNALSLCAGSHSSHSFTVSWDHPPNKLPAPKSWSQALLSWKPKESVIRNLMSDSQSEKDVRGHKWSKTWQPQRTGMRKCITYGPPLTK